MDIQVTRHALTKVILEMEQTDISHSRLVYLSDKRWDLTARIKMLARR